MTLCEHEEMEILPKDFEHFRKDKRFRKVMDRLLSEKKDQYILKLVQEGARLPPHFNVKDIIAPKKETKTAEMKSELKIVKDQMTNKQCFKSNETSEEEKLMLADMKIQIQLLQTQLQTLKEKKERSSNKFSF